MYTIYLRPKEGPSSYPLSEKDKSALLDPDSEPTIECIVNKLMNPPKNYKNGDSGVMHVSMEWILLQLDSRHFITDHRNGKRLLHKSSKIFTHGLKAGLPEVYYNWLCEHPLSTRPGDDWVPSEYEYFLIHEDFIRMHKVFLQNSTSSSSGELSKDQNLDVKEYCWALING